MTRRNAVMYFLWGEEKTLSEWRNDPRTVCRNRETVANRMRQLGWSLERALTTPVREWSGSFRKAFGEEKSLRSWSTDPRCVVPFGTLYARVAVQGWPLETAMTTMQHGGPRKKSVRPTKEQQESEGD